MNGKAKKSLSWWLIRGTFALVLVGTVLGLIIYLATREPPPKEAPPIQARLELAAGVVSVDQGEGAQRASSGVALLANATVTTDPGARALVRLPDGSTAFMRGKSSVKLAPNALTLSSGEYWLNAPPTDRDPLVHKVGDVSVSAADAGLSVKLTQDSAVIYVARGMAIVTGKGGRVEVNAGEQATVKGADAPRVAPLAFWDDWTGGMADFAAGRGAPGAGSGTIYGVDTGAVGGAKARRLELQKQVVRAVVRGGLSETEVDQTFFNPGGRDVEGWYWLTLPERASVTSFAVETNGQLIEGEFQEKKEASKNYGAAKSSGHAPAILEWVDAQTYRARIFPVKAGKTRRVVLRYIELRPIVAGKVEYIYPMGRGEPVRIGEFSLSVDLGSGAKDFDIRTLADARLEQGGRRVTMRRSGYTPRADFQLEARRAKGKPQPPLRLARYEAGGESADYVMVRYAPDLDWKEVQDQPGNVIVVVDTSAAGDEASRQLKLQSAEAILRALSEKDRFALVSLDVRPTVLHPAKELAPASDKEIAAALEKLAEHSSGGATDLASSFDVSLKRLHGTEQPAVVYVGDGIATSGEMTGEQLIERLRRALSTSRARLFTMAVGAEANHTLLGELARAGGGDTFRVDESDQTTAQALSLTAAIKEPTITDFEIDLGAGLDEPFVSSSGKVSKGAEVVVLARTHHDIPDEVKVRGRVGGKDFEKTYEVRDGSGVVAAFVPRLWAAEYVRRLLGAAAGPDAERGRIAALGIEYGLMTPFTSILALESEWAYKRMGIQRTRSPLRGVRLGALTPNNERRLEQTLAAPLQGPRSALGCQAMVGSDKEEAPAETQSRVDDNRQGGSGKRAKREEGNMGQPVPTTALPSPPEPSPASEEEPAETPKADSKPQAAAQARRAPAKKPAPGFFDGNKEQDLDESLATAKDEAERTRTQGQLEKKKGLLGRGGLAKNELRDQLCNCAPGDPLCDCGGDGLEGVKQLAKPTSAVVQAAARWQVSQAPALGTCSDIARRPLFQRMLMWKKRLKTANGPDELMQRYHAARKACELGDWRAERVFLDLLQRRIDSEAGVRIVLGAFRWRPEVQKFLARLVLRRTVDARMIAAVESSLFGNGVDWAKLDRELSEIEDIDKRIDKLRQAMSRAPNDPNGDIRLVKLLAKAGKKDEALQLGRRLRDRGFLTPHIARQLGDVLARAKLDAEAVRTYSEIVEFDPENPRSRQLLGDIYLGHGWYAPAYRQYKTLTEIAPSSALSQLRLAAAAAGTGRVDESLRIQRRVASAQGTPGPNDPRRWARLWSAARLARLLDKPPPATPGQPAVDPARRKASIKRKLKELQLFSGPGTLVIVTWEHLDANVNLATVEGEGDKATAVAAGEVTHATPTGLSAAILAQPDYERLRVEAHLKSVKRDGAVPLVRHDVTWDGKDFEVRVKEAKLEAQTTKVTF